LINELFFSDRMWPDFGAEDLAAAVNDFRKRERRFGGVGNAQAFPPSVPSAPAHSTLEQVHTRR
jgi:undecaprenyl diphosphate synthase